MHKYLNSRYLYNIRQYNQKQLELDKDTLIAFADLEKAFDKVSCQNVFQILQQIGVDFKDRQLIYEFTQSQP